ILLRELTACYTATCLGQPTLLPLLPVQYADVAVWQRAWLQGAVLEMQRQYWRTQLADVPALALPLDWARPAVASYRGAEIDLPMEASLAATLKQFSQQQGVTLFMTLLTGLQVLLGRYAGQRDVAVGTPVANRRHVE